MSDIDEGLRSELQRQGIWVTSMQELYNWGRKNSIWPLQFGLACCAIEMIATAASRYDIARFGGWKNRRHIQASISGKIGKTSATPTKITMTK